MSNPNRHRGTLLGLAIGDAMGAAVEFQPPGTFDPVTDYRAGGPHRLNPGEWTDDTSMAFALAASLADVGWDLDDQAERYVRWWRGGVYSVNGRCFDIEITTSGALRRFLHCREAGQSGDRSEHASGNGSTSFRRKQPPEIQGSGYMVKSLEAALWAFHDAQDFREAVLRAVNRGDDADTTGAVCGQLAGA